MADIDFSGLDPREKAKLARVLQALADEEGGEGEGGYSHPDAAADEQLFNQRIQPLVDGVMYLADKVEALEKVVMDDIVGGVTNLYNDQKRSTGIEELKGKFGPMFDEHMGAIKALPGYGDDYDLYGDLFDKLNDMDEGEREPYVNQAHADLLSMLGALRGEKPQEATEEEAGPEDVESEAAPTPDIRATVLALKAKRGVK